MGQEEEVVRRYLVADRSFRERVGYPGRGGDLGDDHFKREITQGTEEGELQVFKDCIFE